jgi:large subunit ribosomal protein L29
MKVDELRVLEGEELTGRLKTARRELYELRFKHAVGQLENSSQIKKVRHDIARIMTVISERELGIASPPSGEVAEPGSAGGDVEIPKKAKKAAKTADQGFEPDAPVFDVSEPEPEEKPKRGRRAKSEKES